MSLTPLDGEFSGTERYSVRSLIGGGSMGLVYEAWDRRRDALVAIKALRHKGGRAIYRLKQEFRAIADIHHPNLVTLYELVNADNTWFIVMELVRGKPFIQYVREEDDKRTPGTSLDRTGTWLTGDMEGATTEEVLRTGTPPAMCQDVDRLRRALVQLCRGVEALHVNDRLHRDLKPSNVLVTAEGRVVLVDFGLIYETDREASELSRVDRIVGTAAFLAPEQIAGGNASTASDVYAVGVILYQALTGRLPFEGTIAQVLAEKTTADAVPPSQLVRGVPEDLDSLCVDLLVREPNQRPRLDEVLQRLGVVQATPAPAPKQEDPRAGREADRQILEDAWRVARHGRLSFVRVRGSPGMGKSTLVRQFLKELRRREPVTVLTGRCYERESVPFKAFDNLMDGLRRRLANLSREQREDILPTDLPVLSMLFPVLDELVEDEPSLSAVNDPLLMRQRGFAASVELLENLSRQRPVAIFIDDAQWGDRDSARLLSAWLEGLKRRKVMVILTYRLEEEEDSTFLSAVLQDPLLPRLEQSVVTLTELPPGAAVPMARALLGREHPYLDDDAEWIAGEADGNPLMMAQLAKYARQMVEAGTPEKRRTRVESLLQTRVDTLDPDTRALLLVIALAGRPLPVSILATAAQVEDVLPAIATLRAERFIRTTRSPIGELVELYNDRIGMSLQSHIGDQETARAHLRLADAMHAGGWADSESLLIHKLAGGHASEAAEHALDAARHAEETLAFEKAAQLYNTALSLKQWPDDDSLLIRTKQAECLEAAGRGEESARAYLALADEERSHAITLRRRASIQLLTTGHLAEAEVHLTGVLANVGLRWFSTSDWTLLVRIFLLRLRLWFMGFDFEPRPEKEIDPHTLATIDTCHALSIALVALDPLRGTYYHYLDLTKALAAKETFRVARAMAVEIVVRADAPPDAWRDIERTARKLASDSKRTHATALVSMAEGIHSYLSGRFRTAYRQLRSAERILTEQVYGTAVEAALARLFAIRALIYTGQIKQASEMLPDALRVVEDRGNVLIGSGLRTDVSSLIRLAADRPDVVRRDIEQSMKRWSKESLHYQHLYVLNSEVFLQLYEGRGLEAWLTVEERWPKLVGAYLQRLRFTRLMMWEMRGRSALAGAARRPELLSVAYECAKELSRDEHRWAQGMGLLIAGLADARAGQDTAHKRLSMALKRFDRTDLQLYAAATRWRLGELDTGDTGFDQIASARGWLQHQGVEEPEKLIRCLAPGWL